MDWLKEKVDIRKDPKNIWAEAKSAIILGMNYGTEKNPIRELKEKKKEFDNTFIELARSVYLKNDKRAEIKKSINRLSNSEITEEKFYAEY